MNKQQITSIIMQHQVKEITIDSIACSCNDWYYTEEEFDKKAGNEFLFTTHASHVAAKVAAIK